MASRHQQEPDIQAGLTQLMQFSAGALAALKPLISRYGQRKAHEPGDLRKVLLDEESPEAYGLLRNLHDLGILAAENHLTVLVMIQAAKALRDEELLSVCEHIEEQTSRQQSWLLGQIKHRAAHTLVVPS